MSTRDASAELPILHEFANRAHQLADEALAKKFNFPETDHFGFMTLCFASKQIEHSRSIQLLVGAGQYIDAAIIARVMLEGYVQLAWAALKPEERAFNWRAYVLVTDFRTLKAKLDRGEIVDEAFKSNLKQDLQKSATQFLTAKARENGLENYPDPYQRTWAVSSNGLKIDIADMTKELNDPNLKPLYEELSQLIHWTTRGIGEHIQRNEAKVNVSFDKPFPAAMAASVSFIATTKTTLLLAHHFNLAIRTNVEQLTEEYKMRLHI
jgi:Family of unknown function (DUF5677)